VDNLHIADISCHWDEKLVVVPAAVPPDFVDMLVQAAGMAVPVDSAIRRMAALAAVVLDFDRVVFEKIFVDPESCQVRVCPDPADPDDWNLGVLAPSDHTHYKIDLTLSILF